jgi:hypothetical protein
VKSGVVTVAIFPQMNIEWYTYFLRHVPIGCGVGTRYRHRTTMAPFESVRFVGYQVLSLNSANGERTGW